MTDWFDEEMGNLKKRMKWEIKELDELEEKLKDLEVPLVHVGRSAKEMVIKVRLPGISRENIKLKVNSDSFEVRADKKRSLEVKRKGAYKSEKSYKGYYRRLSLPAKVDHNKARVEFKDGLLRVSIPLLKK